MLSPLEFPCFVPHLTLTVLQGPEDRRHKAKQNGQGKGHNGNPVRVPGY
jgi:hypothetical protein